MLCSLGEAIRQFIRSLVDLDGRIYKSIFYLLFRPGRLSRDYIEGRRIPYLHPFKLLFVLIILFVFLSKLTFDWSDVAKPILQKFQKQEQQQAQVEAGLQSLVDGASERQTSIQPAVQLTFQDNPPLTPAPNELILANATASKPSAKPAKDRPPSLQLALHYLQNPNDFRDILFDCLPFAYLFQLPLTAFVLGLVYRKPRRIYMEHLVVTVHNHAFYAVAASLWVLLELLQMRNPAFENFVWSANMVLYVVSSLYPLLAYKHVYGLGWGPTLVRAIVVHFAYCVFLAVSLTMAGLLTVGVTYAKTITFAAKPTPEAIAAPLVPDSPPKTPQTSHHHRPSAKVVTAKKGKIAGPSAAIAASRPDAKVEL